MRNLMQKKTARELKHLLGETPGPRMVQLLHHYEANENVARELITGLDPELAPVAAALLDVVDAQLELMLEVARELKSR